jgi:hypothetical protein
MEITTMTKERARTAIIEAINRKRPQTIFDNGYGTFIWWRDGNTYWFDPHRDLNAMHLAESILTPKQRREYIRLLSDYTKVPFDICHVPATRRAEAYIKLMYMEVK